LGLPLFDCERQAFLEGFLGLPIKLGVEYSLLAKPSLQMDLIIPFVLVEKRVFSLFSLDKKNHQTYCGILIAFAILWALAGVTNWT